MSETERIKNLEDKIKLLETKFSDNKVKKEKVPRKPSAYNVFMQNFISDLKKEQGDNYNHKTAFKLGAAEWKNKSKNV